MRCEPYGEAAAEERERTWLMETMTIGEGRCIHDRTAMVHSRPKQEL